MPRISEAPNPKALGSLPDPEKKAEIERIAAEIEARRPLVAGRSAALTLNLDGLYSAQEIAPWLGLSRRTILELARQKKIPCVRFNDRVLRFNPRTILNKGQ